MFEEQDEMLAAFRLAEQEEEENPTHCAMCGEAFGLYSDIFQLYNLHPDICEECFLEAISGYTARELASMMNLEVARFA